MDNPFGIAGVKCDAEGCDYEDMNLSWGTSAEDILAANDKMLNAPCPKCGASLLTPEDHAAVKLMIGELGPLINQMEAELREALPEDSPLLDKVKLNIKMDGSGAITPGSIEKA